MTTLQVTCWAIQCDGCLAFFPDEDEGHTEHFYYKDEAEDAAESADWTYSEDDDGWYCLECWIDKDNVNERTATE